MGFEPVRQFTQPPLFPLHPRVSLLPHIRPHIPHLTFVRLTPATLDHMLPELAADGSNWIVWKTRIQVFLGANRLAQHLDHSTPPPVKPQPLTDGAKEDAIQEHEKQTEKYLEWMRADAEAMHYIIQTIPDSILVKVIRFATSKDLWKAICTELEVDVIFLRMKIKRRIHRERCAEADDVRVHLAKMLRLRDELAATGENPDDEFFVTLLVVSLPESYNDTISVAYGAAAMIDKVPTTQQIIAVIEQEYERRHALNRCLPVPTTSGTLDSNPQKQPPSGRGKKNVRMNPKRRFCHNLEFNDDQSVGGPFHDRDTPQGTTGNFWHALKVVPSLSITFLTRELSISQRDFEIQK